jgi:AcrR family transcriptional regulator
MIAHYFKTRDDLLLFAYRLALAREIDSAPTSRDEKDPLKRLIGILLRALPVDDKSQLDFRIWLGFMGRVADDASLASAVLREHQDYHSKVLDLVRECIEAGKVRTQLGAETLMQHVVIYVDGLGVAAALEPEAYGADTLESTLTTFLSALGFQIDDSRRSARPRKARKAAAS